MPSLARVPPNFAASSQCWSGGLADHGALPLAVVAGSWRVDTVLLAHGVIVGTAEGQPPRDNVVVEEVLSHRRPDVVASSEARPEAFEMSGSRVALYSRRLPHLSC